MFCASCGTSLPAGTMFCSNCGSAQAEQPIQRGVPVAELVGMGGGQVIDHRSGLPYSHRSKVVAGVLQLVLGPFGVGRFYTGHIGLAFAQIAVTWLTCGLGGLWPFIDGIMMLTGAVKDVDGLPLRD